MFTSLVRLTHLCSDHFDEVIILQRRPHPCVLEEHKHHEADGAHDVELIPPQETLRLAMPLWHCAPATACCCRTA